jgi:hypothetical protein
MKYNCDKENKRTFGAGCVDIQNRQNDDFECHEQFPTGGKAHEHGRHCLPA